MLKTNKEYTIIREYECKCSLSETVRRIIRLHIKSDTFDLSAKEIHTKR